MELVDYFAGQVAAALANRIEHPTAIAERAYELADALVRERARRAGVSEPSLTDEDLQFFEAGLLDEPAPISERDEDQSWLEREGSPAWEAESKPLIDVRGVDKGPGLARTTPVPDESDDAAAAGGMRRG